MVEGITTVCDLAPLIRKSFNHKLLMSTLELKYDAFINEILPLGLKKLRPQDTGRKKQFENLIERFKVLYERKAKEEADYKEALKVKSQKRPNLSSGKTMRFSRSL